METLWEEKNLTEPKKNLLNNTGKGKEDITKKTKSNLIKNDSTIIIERKKYYVYHLIDSMNGVVFYVGKGFGRRMYKHEQLVKKNKIPNNNRHLFNKIKQILNRNGNVIYKKILENVDETSAYKREIKEITDIRLINPNLCNIGHGGEGWDNLTNNPNKEEILKKLRINHALMIDKYVRGITLTKERKKRLSRIVKTEEWKQNISNTRKTSDKNKGKTHYMYNKDWMDFDIWRKSLKDNHANFNGENNPFYGKSHPPEVIEKIADQHRVLYKLTYDGKSINIKGGKILREFIDDYNKKHNTKITIGMIRYNKNSVGWKLERIYDNN